MLVETDSLVSITEANQNFSRVARLVDEHGSVVILRNNVPSYVVTTFARAERDAALTDCEVEALADRIIEQHRPAFEALAR
jgi:antitoxin Phd